MSTIQSLAADAMTLAQALQTYAMPSTAATQVVPQNQTTISVAATAPATMFTWTAMPWAWSTIVGFRPGVDRLDAHALIPNYKGTDPVADGYFLVQSTPDQTGTQVIIDPDGPGGAWGTTIVALAGVLPWTVPGEALFSGILPPAPAPLDISKLTLDTKVSDEFDTLDWTKWKTIWNYTPVTASGCNLPGNGEKQWYPNKDFSGLASVTPWMVKDGSLHLTADHMPPALVPLCGYPGDANYPPGTFTYSSGMMQNSQVMSWGYGYIEIQAKLPKGQGMWPAFWLLPCSGAWPPEIDVFEAYGQNPNIAYTTLHPTNGSPSNFAIHTDITQSHRWGLWRDKDWLITYLDGIEVGRLPNTIADLPMYVLLNVAVGSAWGGAPDATTVFPTEMIVDYLYVYTL